MKEKSTMASASTMGLSKKELIELINENFTDDSSTVGMLTTLTSYITFDGVETKVTTQSIVLSKVV